MALLVEPYIVALVSLPKPHSLRRGRYSRSSRGRGACGQSTRVVRIDSINIPRAEHPEPLVSLSGSALHFPIVDSY